MDPKNIWITFPELLIWFPLVAGLVAFMIRNQKQVKAWAIISSLITLAISVTSLIYADASKYFYYNNVSYYWLQYIGSNFSIGLDGMGHLLTALTALLFPVIFIATNKTNYKYSNVFYGLMLLTQSGMMGVFAAMDVLVFYIFWELAVIPIYFLCSRWGEERRIQATFKFFVYTFAGSLLMLIGILYVYMHTAGTDYASHSFSMNAFYAALLSAKEQDLVFWLFFIAFAIKMPVFPFHTWQPDTYEQAPASATMVLSGIMVKMGVFAVIRWILPIFPEAVNKFDNIVIGLSVIGMVYASLIAIKQDDLKRFVAYSSIAHIGLMCAAIFTKSETSLQGVMVQMFNHGINIIGMWIVVDLIEKNAGTRKISELGGVAHKAPVLTIFLVIIALANIALPLTNAFVGEFMMFAGLFKFNMVFAAVALVCIILAAAYTLNMVQKVFYGEANAITEKMLDISFNQKLVLAILVVFIFLFGVYPQPVFELTKETISALLVRIK
ncbi:MAG: NADH-quinone oxidoreductase subunit M [Ferruginibacter sp.]|nr:NADH-quinone oxidoreductase subunit M [Bacteroidota bacterium]MBX2920350.1 NADH-quinone oxidoreductase subunit M [Ferruginibacter sp.]MCB0709849.1 NADH-quinone oxidoreductase subunit M [Chitinophagaceae bacterium]MCC7379217.1 NADH-quinone oxidoreductase subunit M [Chitinophagaceae bacterium]